MACNVDYDIIFVLATQVVIKELQRCHKYDLLVKDVPLCTTPTLTYRLLLVSRPHFNIARLLTQKL